MKKYFTDEKYGVTAYTGEACQRKHPRFPVCLQVRFHDGSAGERSDFILSISMGGLFIETDQVIPVGSSIRMFFGLTPGSNEPEEFNGEVVNVNTENPDHPRGLFVKFVDCPQKSLKRLEEFLEKRTRSSKFFVGTRGGVTAYAGVGDRRSHQRFSVCFKVRYYEKPTEVYNNFILNISMGGLFIETDRLLPVGSRLKMLFSIPPKIKELGEYDGEVVKVNADGRSHPRGLFIKFVGCTDENLARLEGFLEGERHLLDKIV